MYASRESSRSFLPVIPGYEASFVAILLTTFAMTFDFMAVFITIYYYWTLGLNADYRWYGFAFSCYDLAQFIASPILAVWADMRSMKEVLLVTTVLNVIGNILYSMAYKTGPWMLLLGRMIAGAGAGNIAITLAFATKISQNSQRIKIINWLRLTATIGRFSGPLVGILFLQSWFPEFSVFGEFEFNPYTSPAWFTSVLSLLCFFVVLFFLKEPTEELKNVQREGGFFSFLRDVDVRQLLKQVLILNGSRLFVIVGFWVWYAQIVPIAATIFQFSRDKIGNVYIGVGIGFGASSFLITRFLKIFGTQITMLLGGIGVTAGVIFFFQWHQHEEHWILYTASAIACGSFAFFNTTFTTAYTQLTQKSPYSISMLGVLSMTGSLGRFLGPFVSSFPIEFSGDETCCDKQKLLFDCCRLHGLDITIATAATLSVIGLSVFFCYTTVLRKVRFEVLFEDEEEEQGESGTRSPLIQRF